MFRLFPRKHSIIHLIYLKLVYSSIINILEWRRSFEYTFSIRFATKKLSDCPVCTVRSTSDKTSRGRNPVEWFNVDFSITNIVDVALLNASSSIRCIASVMALDDDDCAWINCSLARFSVENDGEAYFVHGWSLHIYLGDLLSMWELWISGRMNRHMMMPVNSIIVVVIANKRV